MKLEWEEGGVLINEPSAGLLTIFHDNWVVHLGVGKDHRRWGKTEFWFDGPFYDIGFGPLARFIWLMKDRS